MKKVLLHWPLSNPEMDGLGNVRVFCVLETEGVISHEYITFSSVEPVFDLFNHFKVSIKPLTLVDPDYPDDEDEDEGEETNVEE